MLKNGASRLASGGRSSLAWWAMSLSIPVTGIWESAVTSLRISGVGSDA